MTGGAQPNYTALYGPPTPQSERGGLLGTDRAVTTVGKGNIKQHLIKLDTRSALTSNTLVSRAEPPPSGWTDIILEQTYEYWSM